MQIFVTGPSCSGKSTTARLLSIKYKLSFTDLDQGIEQIANKPVSAIFLEDGEQAFRKLESDLLQKCDTDIVATGGGTMVAKDNVNYMKKRGKIVLLLATPIELVKRLETSYERPLIQGDRLVTLCKMLGVRAADYCRADYIVDTTNATPDEVAQQIYALMSAT